MRAFTSLGFGLLAAVAATSCAVAGPLEDAKAALAAKDFSKAAALLQPLADQGNVDAQYNLAQLYLLGEGVEHSFQKGIQLLISAADQNDPRAQLDLGVQYEIGIAIGRDDAKAFELFRKSAEQRYAPGEFEYSMTFTQKGDWQQSFFWERRSCEDGYFQACGVVAQAYEWGLGTAKNPVEASRLYHKSLTTTGEAEDILGIGRLAAQGLLVGADATTAKPIAFAALTLANDLQRYLVPSARKEPGEELVKLLPTLSPAELKAGKARYAQATAGGVEVWRKQNGCTFVDMLMSPGAGKPDAVVDDCRRLAALGVPVGEYNLGWLNLTGYLVPQDSTAALKWLTSAANADFAAAELVLGKEMTTGGRLSTDPVAALGWLMVAEPRLRLPDLTANYHDDAVAQLKAQVAAASIEDYGKAADWAARWNAAHPIRPQPEAVRLTEDAILLLRQQDARGALVLLDKAIAIDVHFAQAYNRRAEAKFDLDDLRGARADASSALLADPRNAEARFHLAQIDYAEGDYATSVKELTADIAIDQTNWMPFTFRARSYRALGDYERAIADDNKALEIAPSRQNLLAWRGLDYFLAGRFEESAADYELVAGSDPGTPRYAALFAFISLGHAHKNGTPNLAKASAGAKDNSWPLAVMHYYLGTLSEPGLMASAPKPEERCEARYYIGELKLLAADKTAARSMFQAAVDTCPKDFSEYTRAVHELEMLAQ